MQGNETDLRSRSTPSATSSSYQTRPLRTYEARIQETVASLNTLLTSLSLPIALETPSDLTPSLLVAILESILQERLPIPQATRDARDFSSKVQAVKVFLGVLESDVVDGDVDLSNVDPRMLALGEWDEVTLVAETLCTVGAKFGLLPGANTSDTSLPRASGFKELAPTVSQSEDVDSDPFWMPPRTEDPSSSISSDEIENALLPMSTLSIHASSITTTSATTRSRGSASSILQPSAPDVSSATTAPSAAARDSPTPSRSLSEPEEPSSPSIAQMHYRTATPSSSASSRSRHTPRCIHEVPDDPSYTGDEDPLVSDPSSPCCHCAVRLSARKKPLPVRYSGWIEPVDHEEEMRAFEARRRSVGSRGSDTESPPTSRRARAQHYAGLEAASSPRTPSSPSPLVSSGRIVTRHNSPSQHTLALLNERAKLLEELARAKASRLR